MTSAPTLKHAIAVALGTSALLSGIAESQAASTTMYNLYAHNGTTPCAVCFGGFTDGWVWGFDTPSPGDANAANPGWAGTSSSTSTPFGYKGDAIVNWGVALTANTDSATISNADSLARYNISANIDTAQGSWQDNASSGASGWTHDLDLGLFRSDVSSRITLSATGVNLAGTDFGFTVFKGMNQAGDGYSHHSGWNTNGDGTPLIPGGFTPADIVATTDASGATPVNLNQISFDAEAGQVYTIALGGFRSGGWDNTRDGYVLSLNAAPVPLPAAVWFMGSALAGFVTIGRRPRPKSVEV